MQRPYDALHDAKYDALQEALKLQFDRTVAELVSELIWRKQDDTVSGAGNSVTLSSSQASG